MDISKTIAEELGVKIFQVESGIKLIDGRDGTTYELI